MAMIAPFMPGDVVAQMVYAGQAAPPGIGVNGLAQIEKLAVVDDNTCCDKVKQAACPLCTTCCCPRRYKVTDVAKGYNVGNTLYNITETSCCCPNQWTLTDLTFQQVHVYSRKFCTFFPFSICFGGPGFDVHEMINGGKGAHQGSAQVPFCQCCDSGYDIRSPYDTNLYFVGTVCHCCEKGMDFHPVWNDDKTEVLKMNVHVRPCLKKYLPCFCCCMDDYWIIDFPTQAIPSERSQFIAGTLLKEAL